MMLENMFKNGLNPMLKLVTSDFVAVVILRSIYNLRKELRHQVVTQVVTQVDFQMRRQNAFHYLIDDYFGECAILWAYIENLS